MDKTGIQCPELAQALEQEGRRSHYGNASQEIYGNAIPDECHRCILTVIASNAAYRQEVTWKLSPEEEQQLEVEAWSAKGVLLSIDDEIYAVEEFGLGDESDNCADGRVSATFARLVCSKSLSVDYVRASGRQLTILTNSDMI